MATKKISELTAASTLNGTELVPVVQSSATKKTTVADFATLIGDGADGIDGIDGAPGPAGASADSIFTIPANARKWAAALAARTVASPARFIWYGDSVTELVYGNPVDRLRARMARFNGGRVSPGWVHGAPLVGDVTGGVNPFHTNVFRLTTGTLGANEAAGNYPGERGLALYSFKLNSGSVLTLKKETVVDGVWTDAVTASPTFATAEFHYTAHGTDVDIGTAEIRIDGTLVQTVNGFDATVSAGAYESGHTYTWTGDEGPHTITITGAGSDPFWFDGVYLAHADETVWVYNAGNAGEKYADFLNEPAGHADPPPLQVGALVDADAVVFAYGIIDHNSGDSAATFGTNVTTAITTARTLIDDVSIGVLISYATGTATDWGDFVDAAKASAAAADVGVIDTSWMLETNAATTDPHDLIWDTDDTHQNAAGGEFWADRVAQFLIGDNIDWGTFIDGLLGPQVGGIGTHLGQFRGQPFVPAVVSDSPIGAGTATVLLRDNSEPGAIASTGTVGQVSQNVRDETGSILAGVGSQAWMRFARSTGSIASTDYGLDILFGNAANGSTTVAEVARLRNGGGLQLQAAATIYSGSGVPSAGTGANGDLYIRTGAPSTANQRLYMKASGAWVGVV